MINLVIISEISGGGVEKVNDIIAKNLNLDIFNTHIISLVSKQNEYRDFKFGYNCIFLEAKKKKYSFLKLIDTLKKICPDIICTSCLVETYYCYLYKKIYNHNVKIVYSEHGVWSQTTSGNIKNRILNGVIPKVTRIFEKIDKIICVSDGVLMDFCSCFPNAKSRCIRIYNPCEVYEENYKPYKPIKQNEYSIVTVGRLERIKDQGSIIRALKVINNSGSDVKLYIYGKGECLDELHNLVADLNMEDKVFFKGFVNNIHEELKKYDVFVLSSKWESFGLVLVEAMNAGLPVVTTDCPVGPTEILANGKFGYLIELGSVEALANGILMAVRNHSKKRVQAAYERSLDFSVKTTIDRYEKLFLEIFNG